MIPGMARKAAEAESRRLAVALKMLDESTTADGLVRALNSFRRSSPVGDRERTDLAREVENAARSCPDDEFLSVVNRILRDGRVCPVPARWHQLWERLPGRERTIAGKKVGPPLILAAWWHSTPSEKRQRLLEHLRYAHEMGALDESRVFLDALSEAEWVTLRDAPSGRASHDDLDERLL